MIARRILPCVALVLILGLPLSASGAAVAPVLTWGEPVPISQQLPTSWFPDVQADPTGAIRLVWSADLAEGDGNLTHASTGAVMISELRGSGWAPAHDIVVMDAGIASRPLIASDGAYAHLLFRTGILGQVRLAYSRAPLSANLGDVRSWSPPVAISDDNAYYAQISILPDGSLVTVFNVTSAQPIPGAVATPILATRAARTPTAAGAATPIAAASAGTPTAENARRTVAVARRSTDHGRTWSFPTQVSFTNERVGRTTLATSPDGKVLVASWDEGYDNLTGLGDPVGVGTAISLDGGATWRAQQAIRSPLGPIEQSSVGFGADGALLIYRAVDTDQLLYRTLGNGQQRWSDEQPVPGVVAKPYTSKHNFDKVSLTHDGAGRILLAYIGQDATAPKGLAVMVASFVAGQWFPATRVAAPDGYPEYPRLAVALGNQLQLVYFVRDKQFDVGHYVLYSVAGQSDTQALAPVAPTFQAAPVGATPTIALPPITLRAAPAIPNVPAPLPAATTPLLSPQDVVTGPGLRALTAALLVIIGVWGVVTFWQRLRLG